MEPVKRRIDQEPWCQELIKRLRQHKANEARLEFLEDQLERSVYPITKLVASYDIIQSGTGLGAVTAEEVEFRELLYEVRQISTAKSGLEKLEKFIVVKTYEENLPWWQIVDIEIPKEFIDKHKRPLYPAKRTYHRYLNRALIKMAKTLGISTNGTILAHFWHKTV